MAAPGPFFNNVVAHILVSRADAKTWLMENQIELPAWCKDDAKSQKGAMVTLSPNSGNGAQQLPKRRRPPLTRKRETITQTMLEELKAGTISEAELRQMIGKTLVGRYGAKRTTCCEARKIALSQFNSDK